MANNNSLVVFALDDKDKAHELLKKLEEMDIADDNIEIKEAAFAHKVSEGHVKLEQSDDLGGGRGAFGGGAIGLIAGTMVAGPLGAAVGGVVGSAVAGLYAKLRDSGVNDNFMKEVAGSLDTGKTALFIMYTGVISQDMLKTLQDYHADVIHGTLPAAAESAITAVYEAAGEEVAPEMDVFTSEATEADTVADEATVAAMAAQAAEPPPEAAIVPVPEEAPPPVVVDVAPAEVTPAPVVTVTKPEEPVVVDVTPVEVTPAPVAAMSAVPLPIETPAQAAQAAPAPDNLTVLEGIGPKVSAALAAAGITTYAKLSRTSELELQEALLRGGVIPPKSVETWPRQARFAAVGDWAELYKFNSKRKLAAKNNSWT